MGDAVESELGDAVTQAEWLEQARLLFGDDPRSWRFYCVSCGTVSSVADFEALGVDGQRAPYECIGRVLKELNLREHVDGDTQPCNWFTNGLLHLSGLTRVEYEARGTVKRTLVFPFAPEVTP